MDLRYDLGKVEAWRADGREIEITKHGKPLARLCSLGPLGPLSLRRFDADAHRQRMKETWGERISTAAEVGQVREAELGDRS